MARDSKPRKQQRLALIPQKHGGALLPGGTGAGGRPPDQFKAMCRELASADAVRQNVEKILANPGAYPKLYVGALKWATEHGYGKPVETVNTTNETTVTIKQEWTFGTRTVRFG